MGISVAGRVVLITGAAMGMGRLYAERAVHDGAAAVVLWDLNAEALEVTAAQLRELGASAIHPYAVDVASLPDITATADQVIREVGVPDILVNNAGIVRGKYFWEHEPEADIDAVMQVNTLAPMQVTRAFLPGMIERRTPARILNVASASGTLSVPKMSVYTASKWAVIGWSDSMRLELTESGNGHVAVTTLIPSYIKTGMFEGARGPLMTPLMEPEYVVDKAWEALLAGKARIQLPWTVALGSALRNVLPQPAWDVVAGRVFKVYQSMDHFTGRKPAAPADETSLKESTQA
ncbi:MULTISPECIES: SDR family NAD(P)-dependent oxidoreductase [unclassified Arthrobacter]|uniref:SDR family NAD(P)-dependent oxidoreductase n=1 Tax=unclassified Arthrobacter TaxID=235627 RepID=UPI00210419EB|nr:MULTISPECIES: SDR family NAD(P)-dependent oxidoreductase [unclassified Arthrobacter]MCQ1946380.1 SDR family NAD(P)-dependent oxidoreductase [Arthrobacter sp. zg-Y1116]MCQ1986320.1 SDR family NAD(P)-dependent oxidoreductase [Arthrobacter sp. zg-Y844]MCQ1993940.1 SDR family NAD(P)-dependent oxidoreductase [Arthrobacter sp. zg-Y1171]UWX81944.1 SDR family NAD(P)-dependent oxidoreductase [Arthrobacter sp. zg-Y1171]